MTLSWLGNEVTLCPLDATSGEVSEGAYLDMGTSYRMIARDLVWAGLPGCPEFFPPCWRVTCSLCQNILPLSDSIVNTVLLISFLFAQRKKEAKSLLST